MKISIIIPTCERVEFLEYSLAACCDIRDDNVEIIVSDNFSADLTKEVVGRVGDSRVRYINTGQRLSMRLNFEYALAHADGDYIIMIGDDDAILPGQFSFLRKILEDRKPDSLSWKAVHYFWPNEDLPDGGGRIKLARKDLFGPVRFAEKAQLQRTAVQTRSQKNFILPMIYGGAISMRVVEAMRSNFGGVFLGSWPDIYSNFASLSRAKNHIYLMHPFSISGIGKKSHGFSFSYSATGVAASDSVTSFINAQQSDEVVDLINHFPTIEIGIFAHMLNACQRCSGSFEGIDFESEYSKCLTSLPAGYVEKLELIHNALLEIAKVTETYSQLSHALEASSVEGIKNLHSDKKRLICKAIFNLGELFWIPNALHGKIFKALCG